MDQVKVFMKELSSIIECRPPISKAKMTSVTKSALKAIKYYKHVVQGVEKFIQKCKPEYKVPGLYVIDSIVRQSRHQHGPENDVFAQRFAKNFKITLQHLFRCPEDQRPKIVRVLNLWQKNKVFSSEVIQPLLDMAHPNAIEGQEEPLPGFDQREDGGNNDSSGWSGWNERGNQEQASNSNNQDSQNMFNQSQPQNTDIDFSNLDAQSICNLQQLASQITNSRSQDTVKFNKKLLDFDYGDEDEEENGAKDESSGGEPTSLAVSMAQNLLANPELIQQLQQMQQTIQQTEALKDELNAKENLHKEKLRQQEEEFNMQLQVQEQQQMQFPMEQVQGAANVMDPNMMPPSYPAHLVPNYPPPAFNHALIPPPTMTDALTGPFAPESISEPPDVIVLEGDGKDVDLRRRDEEEKRAASPQSSRYNKRRHRSRSPPSRDHRDKRSRRSRSPSRSRSSRYRRDRRSRSRSRDKDRDRERDRDRDRERDRERENDREKERERERERRKKGLPPIRKNYMNVCSTTLWLGHVPKTVPESEIHDVFGEFGTVATVNIIPPRGCAYVCMDRRQDAYRALMKLRNLKLQNSSIKMAWAPGKGMKGKQYKDFWDVDLGVSCIPYDKIPDDVDLDLLEEGGTFDEDTVPSRIKEKMEKIKTQKSTNLRQMNTDDLLALVEAQAPEKAGANPNAQQPGSVMAPPTSTTANTLINPSGVPIMQPVVQPQFAGMPPMPIPGQPVMLPHQVPGFQPGVRFAPVLPQTSSGQLIPPSFPGPMVGALPMGVATSTGIIRHPGLIPQPIVPTANSSGIAKGSESTPTDNPNPKPKRTTTRFSSITESSTTSANIDSSLKPQDVIANIPVPGVVQGIPTPLMTAIGNFIPPVSEGPEKISSGEQKPDLNATPDGSSAAPVGHPSMQDGNAMVPGEMPSPFRFPGMRFNAPRMPRLMPPRQIHPMRMMGHRPPFPGDEMMRPERPWMDREMYPPHPDFDGDDRFDPDRRRFMERDHFRGPPHDWHEPFDRYHDRPPYDRWNDDRRWERDRGGREPWDDKYRDDYGPPRRDRLPRGRSDWERNRPSRFAPADSDDKPPSENKAKESDDKRHRDRRSPEPDGKANASNTSSKMADGNDGKEKDEKSTNPFSNEAPPKLNNHPPSAVTDPPASKPLTPLVAEAPQAVPFATEQVDKANKQETVKTSRQIGSDKPKDVPEATPADDSGKPKL